MWFPFVGLKVVKLYCLQVIGSNCTYVYIYMYTMYDIHRLIYFCMIYIEIKAIHNIFVDLCCRLLEELRPTTWDVPEPH